MTELKIKQLERELKIYKHFYRKAIQGWKRTLDYWRYWILVWFILIIFTHVAWGLIYLLK